MQKFLGFFLPKLIQPSSNAPQAAIMSTQRVTAEGWKVQPIEHPVTAPWSLDITGSDVNRLMQGFAAQDMDDRWMCNTDGPDQQGNIVVHLYRSWTGNEHFQIKAKSSTDDAEKNGAKIVEIKWERGQEHNEMGEEEAKDMAVMLCRNVLGCKLEAIP